MDLIHISFENYKAFKKQQTLEIKPLTILIGKNSAGKSIVSRLPLLLAKSLKQESDSSIELEFDGLEFGSSFKDLIHNKIEHGNITFTLIFQDNKIPNTTATIKVVIQNIADSPLQFISQYEISYGSLLNLKLKHTLKRENIYNEFQEYSVVGDIEEIINVKYKGLLIEEILSKSNHFSSLKDILSSFNDSITKCISNIDYIGPFRAQPKRDYIFKGSRPTNTGYSGELAPHILGIDEYFPEDIKRKVGEWYAKNLGGWKLDINKINNKFEVVLLSPDDENVKVNLVDVGHGMSQVLPLIVRSYFSPKGNHNSIMIVEQPELHLHPAAHGELAELFVRAIQNEKSKWIIETHSEVFILRVRRLIAERKLNQQDVVLYWVNDENRPGSEMTKIEIDSKGNVDFWPNKIFQEDFEEVLAIRKAQN